MKLIGLICHYDKAEIVGAPAKGALTVHNHLFHFYQVHGYKNRGGKTRFFIPVLL